ncbi:MAG TPA: hypothetical protein VF062_17235 [Candidatus Limnocylindrales bacterium]
MLAAGLIPTVMITPAAADETAAVCNNLDLSVAVSASGNVSGSASADCPVLVASPLGAGAMECNVADGSSTDPDGTTVRLLLELACAFESTGGGYIGQAEIWVTYDAVFPLGLDTGAAAGTGVNLGPLIAPSAAASDVVLDREQQGSTVQFDSSVVFEIVCTFGLVHTT